MHSMRKQSAASSEQWGSLLVPQLAAAAPGHCLNAADVDTCFYTQLPGNKNHLTEAPSEVNLCASLPMLVVFPPPLTPTTSTTAGDA